MRAFSDESRAGSAPVARPVYGENGMKNLHTGTSAARELGVCRKTILRWRRRGAPHVRVVGARGAAFDLDALREWRRRETG